jgi:hypothetical protein
MKTDMPDVVYVCRHLKCFEEIRHRMRCFDYCCRDGKCYEDHAPCAVTEYVKRSSKNA